MLSVERRVYILEQLKENTIVKVDSLSEELNVTAMTIRRDLDKLEEDGLVSRTYGGAVLKNALRIEDAYETKKDKNQEAKLKLAKAAYELIEDGDTILLDSGTTTYDLAVMLKNKKNLTIVTGDLIIASAIYNYDCDLFFAGGKVQKETGAVFDELSTQFISGITVDIAFLGVSAVSVDWHLTTATFGKAFLKKKMIEISRKTVLLADSSKFGKEYFVKIEPIEKIDTLITDKQFSEEDIQKLNSWDVAIEKV